MDKQPILLQGGGFSAALWDLVQPRLAAAVAEMDLGTRVGAVRLSADDLPGDDDAWYRLLPGNTDSKGAILGISCHVDSFFRLRPLTSTVFPPRAVWDQMDAPGDDEGPGEEEFSSTRTDIFLHHHLLTAGDMLAGDLVGQNIPERQVEAFAATWAVSVDGRLERRHLPGYAMAERRGRFSRLFSSAGILMPEHWQVFQSLWDGALAGQKAILGVTRLLPRL